MAELKSESTTPPSESNLSSKQSDKSSAKQSNKQSSKQSRWYRANLWIHRWISLIVVIPFAILSITGVILIFHEEIDHALGHGPEASISVNGEHRPFSDSIKAAQQAYPNEKVIMTSVDEDHHPGVMLIGMVEEGKGIRDARWIYADVPAAKLVEAPNSRETLTGFLLELHAEWFMGFIGQLIGALIALLVFLSLVSGLVVYAPYVKKFLFGIIRRQKGSRIFQLDLHNLIGSAVLGWALVVTITGFLLGIGTVAIGVWQMTELQRLQQTYAEATTINPNVQIDQVYQAAASGSQGWHPTSVYYPTSEYSTQGHYLVLLQGHEGIQEKLLRIALVDAGTGELTTVEDIPVYLKAIFLSQPLHFGNYGGLALKLLWTLCTLMTLFITVNGAWLWWAKSKQKNLKGERNATVE